MAEKFLVSHPERQHSDEIAAALAERGMLGHYYHGGILRCQTKLRIPRSRRTWLGFCSVGRRMISPFLTRRGAAELYSRMVASYDFLIAASIPTVDCQAVIAHENSADRTFAVARKRGLACVLNADSVHYAAQELWHRGSNTPASIAKKKREVGSADLILCCSSLAKETYIAAGIPASKVVAVTLGVDVEHFCAKQTDRLAREELSFCYAGRLDQAKGIDLLLTAGQMLVKKGLPFRFRIAGATKSSDRGLIRELETFAEVSRRLTYAELPSFYAQSDVLVLPSRFDSFGMVVAEAMSCGLPVIVSENVGAKDLVSTGVNGWIIPVGDEGALVERMVWCAENPYRVRAMRGAARMAVQRRSWETYRMEVTDILSCFVKTWREETSKKRGADS